MKYFFAIILSALISGCGINTIKKTTYLEPGMTTKEVRNIMGNPDSSEFSNGFMVWKYSLQKAWVGYIPHYLAFDSNHQLAGWRASMNEYYVSQRMWLDALPKQHNVSGEILVK